MSKYIDLRQAHYLSESLVPMLLSADSVLYGVEERRKGNTGFLIPPKSTGFFSMRGFCMDHSLPAPQRGQPLRFFPIDKMMSGPLLLIFRAISEKSLKSPETANQNVQGLVWAIRALDEHPEWDFQISPEQEKFVESAYPGSVSILKRYNSRAKLTAQISGLITSAIQKNLNLPGFGNTPLIPSDSRSVQQVLSQILNPDGAKQPIVGSAFSLLAPQVAAKSIAPSGLQADVEIVNDSDAPFFFQPSNYVAESAIPTQRILFNSAKRAGASFSDDQTVLERIGQGYLDELENTKRWARGVKSYLFPYDPSDPLSHSVGNALRSDLLKTGIENIPIVGNILSAKEAIEGRNWVTGEELTPGERLLAAIGSIPGYGSAKAALKPFGKTVAEVAIPLLQRVDVAQRFKDGAGWILSDTAKEDRLVLNDGYSDPSMARSIAYIKPVVTVALEGVLSEAL